MNFQNFSGEGLTESPPQTPSLLDLRLRPWFSGALRPWFGLRPQFTPPTCLMTPLPTKGLGEGLITKSNTVFPKPQLPDNTIGPNISFQDYVVGLIFKYTSDNILGGRLGGFSENPAWWTSHTGTYSTRNHCTRSFHLSPKYTKIVSG